MKRIPVLGTITNTASPPEEWSGRELRFILQSCARQLIPDQRIADCMRLVIPVAEFVEIRKVATGNYAFYKNLAVCGSVWHCPVCATKISEQRRKQLQHALNVWRGGLTMITYTFAHNASMRLPDGLNSVSVAYRACKAGKAYQTLKKTHGVVGSVRALEITYGKNGWHPHIHELVFTEKKLDETKLSQMNAHVWRHWSAALKREGKWAHSQHGINVKTAESWIADYIAKYGHEPVTTTWDTAHEITKQVTKKGKTEHGRTPMQLLFDYFNGDNKAGTLWREYALTLKGHNQLVWTTGLKGILGVKEDDGDLAIAEQEPESSILLAQLTREQWRAIVISNMRGEVLERAGWMKLKDFSEWLGDLIRFYSP